VCFICNDNPKCLNHTKCVSIALQFIGLQENEFLRAYNTHGIGLVVVSITRNKVRVSNAREKQSYARKKTVL